MANLIILEGLSRTGKSTICKTLSDKYKFRNISIKDKMPENVKLPDFYHGIHIAMNEIYREFPEETFILDRSFLSEIVYSSFFNRKTLQTKDSIKDLLISNKFVLFYLKNTHEDYIKRSPKDRITYSKAEYEQQTNIFDINYSAYKILYEESKQNFLKIDTSSNPIETCIEKIEKILKINNFIHE
jgi:thymidylate kinase